MSKFIRKSFLAAAALFVAICTVVPRAALWAQEKMPDDHMKMMAADPDQAQKMATEQAKMMVMDHMAREMAMDPKFQQMAMQSMSDQNMKKVHDDAKAMAQDPAQMAKLQKEIMADSMAMQMVMHMADKMAMMHDDKMKDMPAEKK